ncbi:MAG: CpXC domain-containing protein [Pseudooceanicola sp.]|nr:CpXC domain-containing protein [Pseudooceanicola sp.]
MNALCPNCGATQNIAAVGSVNADRRPDLRAAILDDSFQLMTCAECGHGFRLEPLFNYLEVAKGQWIAAMPGREMPEYIEVEDRAMGVFDVSYGEKAPAAARAIGQDLKPRVTFGWPAVKEKLLIDGMGLDDITVEMMKMDLLRRLPEVPLSPGTELRLIGGGDGGLEFAWIETVSETPGQQFTVARELYDEIAGNAAGWAKIHKRLTDGPFVDMQKLYMGEGRAA